MAAPKKTDRELAERHKYKLPNGEIAVNVTAISGLMDIDGKSAAFAGAAVKLTREGLNHREVWKEKADRGSRVHSHLEAWLREESIDQGEDEKGFLDALEKFIVEHDPELIEQEAIVLSAKGYGGRFDLLFKARTGPHAGKTVLCDLKTGRRYALEHTLQLSAYRYASGIASYGPDGELGELRPLPAVDLAAGLYVSEDGSYELIEYPANRSAFRAFCALLEAYQWARSDEMKTTIKESK